MSACLFLFLGTLLAKGHRGSRLPGSEERKNSLHAER